MLWLPAALAAGLPTFSASRGVFDAPFELTIVPGVSGDGLYVSIDGSEPSVAYAGPISISGTTIVRAVEVGGDGLQSPTITHTYLFPADIAVQATMDAGVTGSGDYGPVVMRTLAQLPSVSLVLPGGVTTTEAATSAEWIDPDGDDLQVDAGVARTGTTSLGYPKNSLRLYFRSEYGVSNVDFDFWEDDAPGIAPASEQDALSLRSGHDSVFYLGAQGQYTRNAWMDASQRAMGHTAPHGRFAHVYINGQYTGVYHVRERFNASFLAGYLGGDEDDYESVNEGYLNSGSGLGWSRVIAHRGDVQELQRWLRLDHFLDYMVLNYYAGNTWDWTAYHNWAAVGPSQSDAGGFRFYGSDSDICLYYGADVNALWLPGPSDIFPALVAEADPDFLVAWEDAIHRNLEDDGPLTPVRAAERYLGIADSIEDAVVAESARWGGGWWDRDGEWVVERDRLVADYFPARSGALLGQLREAGYARIPAPVFSLASGPVAAGDDVSVELPDGSGAELWMTRDGSDPRRPGGEIASAASLVDGVAVVTLDHSTELRARLLDGDRWGPLGARSFAVGEPAPVVLNEWNAVGEHQTLDGRDFDGSGADDAFGTVEGNGGTWLELVVTQDVDLRGWRLVMTDLRGPAGTVEFTQAAALAALRAGTLVTVSTALVEDARVDPDAGDWRMALTVGPGGAYARADGFRVSASDWQLTVYDAEGHVRFGPVGEGRSPRRGISAQEVGALLANPGAGLAPDDSAYGATTRSTFGAANVWQDGEQDLRGLRGESGMLAAADTGLSPTTGLPAAAPGGCDTSGGNPAAALVVFALLAAGCPGRRTAAPTDTGEGRACFADRDGDGHGDGATPVRCDVGVVAGDDCADTEALIHPEAGERCNEADDDCDGEVDEDPVDPLAFFADGDGDGYGSAGEVVYACAVGDGAALSAGDCDDADAEVHPGADEGCEPVDRDCDGVVSTGAGSAAACPATSCVGILADAPGAADAAYWLEQPSGSVVEGWCDMTTGGWMLVFSRNTASTGSQGGFGGGEENVASLAVSPEAASASGTAVLGWVDIDSLDWSALRLTAAASGSRTYTSRDIDRSALRIDFGEPGYLLYGGDTGYYWCGGPASYTDAGVGAVNNPVDAPADCKYHGSLGSGWDFSESPGANAGLTLCGGDASYFLAASWGGTWISYGVPGGAQAIWVR